MEFALALEQELLDEIGARIRRLRKEQGLSQTAFGQRVGLSRRSISELETGGGTSLSSFIRILKVFGRLNELDQLLRVNSISPKKQFHTQVKKDLP